jgi:hypothetical protein
MDGDFALAQHLRCHFLAEIETAEAAVAPTNGRI